jgi:LAO/AO transport system kinase
MTGEQAEALRSWADKVLGGDRRAISRAICAIESEDPAGIDLVKLLFPFSGKAYIVGLTGPPGAGKSTLAERLATEYRRGNFRVGIIAVDLTSPFSGGAILGDRIRMQALANDDGVFIRSMATRGQLGGLASAAHDAVTILEAAGCDFVLIETVGVGQDEVDVARLADVTVLILVFGMGDDVQALKAGVMEIADVFVVNKADRPGADRLQQEVASMQSLVPGAGPWRPPVLKTAATTGEGITALSEALQRFRAEEDHDPTRRDRRRTKWRMRLLELLRQELLSQVVKTQLRQGQLEGMLTNWWRDGVIRTAWSKRS